MSRKRKRNPVYARGLEEGMNKGISQSSRKMLDSIKKFEQMDGVGEKTMIKLYEAFGIDINISDEKADDLKRKWGRYS